MKSKRNTKNAKNTDTTYLSLSDFKRIQDNIISNNQEDIYNIQRKEYDNKLKEQSKARMNQWSDSIEQSKKNNLEERKKKFIIKEEEKRRVDEEERKYQELEKKVIIDKANKFYFENQDAVKSFHSKLQLADALKEREYQKEIQKRKEEIDREIENDHLMNLGQKLIDYDRKEKEKNDENTQKKEYRMMVVAKQLKDAKIKKIKEYQERVVEGEIIKKRAKEEEKETKQKEKEKHERQIQMNKELKEANEELERMKEMKKLKDQIEEKKIEDYAIKKQEMIDFRKKKENEKFKEKQRQRQILIDKQIEYLKNLKDKQDEQLNKQVKEVEEKRNNELAEKQRKLNEFKVSEISIYIMIKYKSLKLKSIETRQFKKRWRKKKKKKRMKSILLKTGKKE